MFLNRFFIKIFFFRVLFDRKQCDQKKNNGNMCIRDLDHKWFHITNFGEFFRTKNKRINYLNYGGE